MSMMTTGILATSLDITVLDQIVLTINDALLGAALG